jgi:hypothetical protein
MPTGPAILCRLSKAFFSLSLCATASAGPQRRTDRLERSGRPGASVEPGSSAAATCRICMESGGCCTSRGGNTRVRGRLVRNRFGPARAHAIVDEETTHRQGVPGPGTLVSVARNSERTPPAQDVQLETPPDYPVAGNSVIAAHLRLCSAFFAA